MLSHWRSDLLYLLQIRQLKWKQVVLRDLWTPCEGSAAGNPLVPSDVRTLLLSQPVITAANSRLVQFCCPCHCTLLTSCPLALMVQRKWHLLTTLSSTTHSTLVQFSECPFQLSGFIILWPITDNDFCFHFFSDHMTTLKTFNLKYYIQAADFSTTVFSFLGPLYFLPDSSKYPVPELSFSTFCAILTSLFSFCSLNSVIHHLNSSFITSTYLFHFLYFLLKQKKSQTQTNPTICFYEISNVEIG